MLIPLFRLKDNCPISYMPSWLRGHVSKCKLTQGLWRYFCMHFDFRTGRLTNLPREKNIKGSYNSLFKTAGESFYVQTHARIGVLIQSQLQTENGQLITDYAKQFQNLDRDLSGSSN